MSKSILLPHSRNVLSKMDNVSIIIQNKKLTHSPFHVFQGPFWMDNSLFLVFFKSASTSDTLKNSLLPWGL